MKAEKAVARAIEREGARIEVANGETKIVEPLEKSILKLAHVAIEAHKTHLRAQGVEKIARVMFKQDHDESWENGEKITKGIYTNNAQAALDAMLGEG